MAHEKWFISDTHFFHENIIQYCGRPFANADLMNESMITAWNSVVSPNDYVYHLGDIFLGGNPREQNELLYSLNGNITLIVGNHDHIKIEAGRDRYRKIELWKGFKEGDFTCVHIPLRLDNLRDGAFCVHGHIHNNLEKDPHYINVCVEHTNYTPIHMDAVLQQIKDAKYKLTHK